MDLFQLFSILGFSFIFCGYSRALFVCKVVDLWPGSSVYTAFQSYLHTKLKNDAVPAHPGSHHCLVVYALNIQAERRGDISSCGPRLFEKLSQPPLKIQF